MLAITIPFAAEEIKSLEVWDKFANIVLSMNIKLNYFKENLLIDSDDCSGNMGEIIVERYFETFLRAKRVKCDN